MSTFLDRMATTSRERANKARAARSESELLAEARNLPPPPALRLAEFDVIAEIKLRSPAAGDLADDDFDRRGQAEAYAEGGAAAVSVLTEPLEFDGELEHLRETAAWLAPYSCPVMRKDFLVDPYQVIEARAAGASGVLLIVAMLSDDALNELISTASELGLFVLLEAFDETDLNRLARVTGARDKVLAGVNCRDLRTLDVDFERFHALSDLLPSQLLTVAESGIGNTDDIEAVAGMGYRLALVGSALMRSGEMASTVSDFVAAGRRAVRKRG